MLCRFAIRQKQITVAVVRRFQKKRKKPIHRVHSTCVLHILQKKKKRRSASINIDCTVGTEMGVIYG